MFDLVYLKINYNSTICYKYWKYEHGIINKFTNCSIFFFWSADNFITGNISLRKVRNYHIMNIYTALKPKQKLPLLSEYKKETPSLNIHDGNSPAFKIINSFNLCLKVTPS